MEIVRLFSQTANTGDYYCDDCGWPVVFACCNYPFTYGEGESDWWVYCSCKGCKNHEPGEEIWQYRPDWCKRIEK